MSEPRIALVAEGPTDLIIIEAALKAILRRSFVLNLLQPEETRPEMGGGWGGVFKWCLQFRERGADQMDADPTLALYDLVIVHLDADVADKAYADGGDAMLQASIDRLPLPCARPCPPSGDSVEALARVLKDWLGLTGPGLGNRCLLCIPSKSSEAWLAAALLPGHHGLLTGLECRMNIEASLAGLPKKDRIRKSIREYRARAHQITTQWATVTTRCPQAANFSEQVRTVAHHLCE